ncbi:MAG: hypothetical protein JWO38_306 [Gemmataceae bacterium]|nr:hypothetical protein [Gemmataceae bacterium]
MSSARSAVLVALIVCSCATTASAGNDTRRAGTARTGCPAWRPCGPGETWGGNRFIPQGGYGVDFRPACQRHDDCYDTPGARRKDCDRQLLKDMNRICESSSNPRGCNRRARMFYISVRLFDGSSMEK